MQPIKMGNATKQSKMKPTDETNYSGVTSEHGDEANQISAMKPMDARMKRWNGSGDAHRNETDQQKRVNQNTADVKKSSPPKRMRCWSGHLVGIHVARADDLHRGWNNDALQEISSDQYDTCAQHVHNMCTRGVA